MDEAPISYRVVTEVATATGVDPADLRPLHDVIDPDALESLFNGAQGPAPTTGYVSFNYEGHLVRVEGSGNVSVTPTDHAAGD